MNDEHFDILLKTQFGEKFAPDEKTKSQIIRKAYEKQEHRNNTLLCVIQVAMFILTIAMAMAIYLLISDLIIPVLIIGSVLSGSIICSIIIVIKSKFSKARRIKSNE